MFQTSDFVARKEILCNKLEVCLPLAYPSTYLNTFLHLSHWQVVQFQHVQLEFAKLFCWAKRIKMTTAHVWKSDSSPVINFHRIPGRLCFSLSVLICGAAQQVLRWRKIDNVDDSESSPTFCCLMNAPKSWRSLYTHRDSMQ